MEPESSFSEKNKVYNFITEMTTKKLVLFFKIARMELDLRSLRNDKEAFNYEDRR
jgi:hypothetical protein